MSILHRILTNGFLLVIPVIVWNILFWAKLPHAAYSSDENLPRWLLIIEMILRIAFFAIPLLLIIRLTTPLNKIGLILYVTGSLLYYGSWLIEIYWPNSAAAANPAIILAPYYTPLIFMAGIGLMGNSLLYVLLCVIFIMVHFYHGLVSFGYVSSMG